MAKVEPLREHKPSDAPMAKAKQVSLEADGLVKRYGGRAVVDGVAVKVNSGEVVGLLGPNGAGKTTTFYMVVGLIKPDEGRVLLGGEDITMLPLYQRARRGISYLPQEPSVFRKLTVEQNLLAVLETLPLEEEERQSRRRHRSTNSTSPGWHSKASVRPGRAAQGRNHPRLVLDPMFLCWTSPSPASIQSRLSKSSAYAISQGARHRHRHLRPQRARDAVDHRPRVCDSLRQDSVPG
jgi:ABC-type Fe3+/spermidine/putrescine transport system ATPase subunit